MALISDYTVIVIITTQHMKAKKTVTKKTQKRTVQAQNGVRAFTWFLFSVFLVVSFFCIKYIKETEAQRSAYVEPTTVSVVRHPSKTPVTTPKVIKK